MSIQPVNHKNEWNEKEPWGLKLTSGFDKAPQIVQASFFQKTAHNWLKNVRESCDIGPFWRIHDKLYDLTEFMEHHPGGKFWLEVTQGTDITEAFESAHLCESPEKMLPKFFIKNISTPRFSPFTFKNDGFFMTLKRKARKALEGVRNGPSTQMLLIQDGLFTGFLFTLLYGTMSLSYPLIMLAGLMLTLTVNCAHNFFHQKDNWRMYIFDFSLLSSQEWRVTHAMSHHFYPNTVQDYEIFTVRPYIEFYPIPDKTFAQKYLAMTPLNSFFFVAFIFDYFRRTVNILTGRRPLDYPLLIQPVLILIMALISKSLTTAILFWLALHASCNFTFFWIGWAAGHHSYYTYVESDPVTKDIDWGLHQVISIAERREPMDNLFWAVTTFGNHTLHHLFPTLDHSKLHLLVKPFLETCEDFDVNFEFYSSWDVLKSMSYRVYSNKPNHATTKLMPKKCQSLNGYH